LPKNVSDQERVLSLLGGSVLLWAGVRRKRSWLTPFFFLDGATLLFRAASGYCPLYALLGVKGCGTAGPNIGNYGFLSKDVPGHGGVLVEKSVVVNRPREELFAFWRDLQNLPRVMSHLESVEEHGDHSHWVAKAPAGNSVAWRAEIVRETPNELIAWRSLPGAQIPNSGSVRFKELPTGRGTEIRVILEYAPPAGRLGALTARLFGEEPGLQVESDLRKFKQEMEAGETATTTGQPHG
jgi:uncharacterized membrane protein